MYIQSVDLDNFRNYGRLHLKPGRGINVLYGDNGQGKSNLLEALYLAAVNKSFRGAKDKEMIRFGEKEAHVKLILSKKDVLHRIDLHLKESGNKGIAVDSVPIRKTRDFLGMLNCVLFSPEDLQIVKNGPSERRRFLDTELCVLDPIYFDALTMYKKVLEQRNQLLKDIFSEPSLIETLSVWDEQLVRYGNTIIERRMQFLKELDPLVRDFHEKLSGKKESLSLVYEPNVSPEQFQETLKNNRNRDVYSKNTGNGPHRDDFEFRISFPEKERPLIDSRVYGSQGQQRTCALALKMAEIEIVRRKTSDTPILLLDDVLSELDGQRQTYLLDSLEDVQTFITCTGLDDFIRNSFNCGTVYRVSNGEIENGNRYSE